MKTCTISGCDQPARSLGLCRRHYDASRRGTSAGKKPGPAPKYSDELREKYGGAPSISVRLDPETWEAVKERGGSTWVRQLVTEELEREAQDEGDAAAD